MYVSFFCLMYEVTEKVGFFCRKPHTCCIPKQHKRHLVPSCQKHSALQRIGEEKKRDCCVHTCERAPRDSPVTCTSHALDGGRPTLAVNF